MSGTSIHEYPINNPTSIHSFCQGTQLLAESFHLRPKENGAETWHSQCFLGTSAGTISFCMSRNTLQNGIHIITSISLMILERARVRNHMKPHICAGNQHCYAVKPLHVRRNQPRDCRNCGCSIFDYMLFNDMLSKLLCLPVTTSPASRWPPEIPKLFSARCSCRRFKVPTWCTGMLSMGW